MTGGELSRKVNCLDTSIYYAKIILGYFYYLRQYNAKFLMPIFLSVMIKILFIDSLFGIIKHRQLCECTFKNFF